MKNSLFSFDQSNFCGALEEEMSLTGRSSANSGEGGYTETQCNYTDGSFGSNGMVESTVVHSFHYDEEYAGKECNFDGSMRQDGSAESGVVHSGGAGLLQDDLHLQEFVFFNNIKQQQQDFSGCGSFNDLEADYIFSSILTHEEEEIVKFAEFRNLRGIKENEPEKEQNKDPAVSLKLITDFGNRVKRFKSERVIEPTSVEMPGTDVVYDELSTVEILRIAAAKFVQSCSAGKLLDSPYSMVDLSLGGVPDEYAKKVELAETLIAVAEKVGNEQFESANRLLKHCQELSSSTGNAVERVGYYFSEALQDRIDARKEKLHPDGLQKKKQSFDMDDAMVNAGTKVSLACRESLPFCEIHQSAGIQTIVENVKEAKRIHIIDLIIMTGVQWTILMQALAARSENPIEHLKITAIGTTWKNSIEETGKSLTCFAESLKLPFSFKMVMESELADLKRELLELDGVETVAIYSGLLPRGVISTPDRLDSIMKTFSDICPCIMVFVEVESNQNSSSFVHRFVETLFFYGAYFDCLNTCMEKDGNTRRITESVYFAEGIRSALAAEGEDRMIRNVNLDAWRKFFARFAMEEVELSSSCLCAAKMTLQRFPNWNFFTMDPDGKSLVIGWKGTPLTSLSTWKFLPGPRKFHGKTLGFLKKT